MPAKGWDSTKPGSQEPAETVTPPVGGTGPAVRVSTAPDVTVHAEVRSQGGSVVEETTTVVVDDVDGKKRRKKKYSSKSARDFQEMGNAVSKGAFRMSNAIAVGLDTFYRNQNRSAKRKKDGMVKDVMLNTARGFRDAGAEAARAPYDVYKRVDVWRQARRMMKMFTDPMRAR